MNAIEREIVSEVKKAWLTATTPVQQEIENLILGERGFVANNAKWLLVVNGIICFEIGWLVHSIF